MPEEQHSKFRLRFIIALVTLLFAAGGLLLMHTSHERESAIFIVVTVSLTLFAISVSYYLLQQLSKIESSNIKLLNQQEELKLKSELLDAASDVVLLLDNDLKILYFNKALTQLTGYVPDELTALGLHGIQTPDSAGRISENFKLLIQNGTLSTESAYQHKSGTIIPVEVHARLITVGGRKLILSMVRDITERKEMEHKLLNIADQWSNTFDAAEDAIWLLDMEHRIVRANKATELIFGISPEEVVGRNCCEVAHNATVPIKTCPTKEMMGSGSRSSSQLQIAGKWFEVSVDPILSPEGDVINIVHIVSNITKLKRAELREHTRADILDMIVSGESLSNLLSFIAVSIEKENPEMLCSILLVSEDGKRLLNGAAPSLPDYYNSAVNRTKIAEGSGSCGTAAFRRERVVVEDISTHPYWKGFKAAEEAGLRSCWSEPIISSTGQLLGTFAIYHRTPASPTEDDFFLIQQASAFASIAIERSKGDSERMELEHLLSQSQKMEAIGHLSGGIAHDFNNLLTPILIYADMLKRSLPTDNKKALSQLDGIIKASGKARDLTQQLLSFGRKQVMQMNVLDLNDIILSFHSMLRRTLRENISISLALSSKPAVIRGDSSKLEQVLLNLVLNSQDAIAANGSISFETGEVLIDEEVAKRHPGMEPGRFILLSCTDNGCGMDGETMKRIFEPFFSTKEVGHGTGLGLANVYGIVKQHKGYIMAISSVGAGTTLKIYLPVCDDKPGNIDVTGEPVDMDQRGSANILLVEDNETVRLMAGELLGNFGYTVYSSDHPERALELLNEIDGKVDLVITDVVMPGMNGQQLFERISSKYPKIDRVLYMSGYTDNIIVVNGELEDGLHFLQKPFTVDALMSKVKALLLPES